MIASHREGVNNILLNVTSKERDIVAFLNELKAILESADFDINTDIFLIQKRKMGDDEKFSTPYTMVDLDYDKEDVVECLKGLNIANYSETKVDKDNTYPPLLYVFGKIINGKMVYIKLKIRAEPRHNILCVSFHYAKNEMKFPYA